jgi:hypothetical protein
MLAYRRPVGNCDLCFASLADQIDASITRERIIAMLAGFFGGLALLLAASASTASPCTAPAAVDLNRH